MGLMELKNAIKVYTDSNAATQIMEEFCQQDHIRYVKDRKKSHIAICEESKENIEPDEAVFAVYITLGQGRRSKAAYCKKDQLKAYVKMLWRFFSESERFVIGEVEDIALISHGTVIDQYCKVISETKDQPFTMPYKEKTCYGNGLMIAKMGNLIRANDYAMEVQNRYPEVNFIFMAAMSEDNEEEYMEAIVFQ